MSLLEFIRLVKGNFRMMFVIALVATVTLYCLTKDEKKQYSSQTVINTGVVSGYTILNHNSEGKVDRDYTRSELQNLLALASAYETTEELSLRLLATYTILDSPTDSLITSDGFIDLKLLKEEGFFSGIDKTDYKSAYNSIKLYRDSNEPSQIKELIYSNNIYFGVEHLATIKKKLKGSSDLLEFSYTTEDPVICQRTLIILTEIFLEKHRGLKESQSNDVLSYFEEATKKSAEKLKDAETKLLQFRIDNNIINYYEQTRFIADKKEDLDEFYFKEKMALEAAKSAKEKLDKQLGERGLQIDLNNQLLTKRDELSNVTNKLVMFEFLNSNETENYQELESWQVKQDELKDEIGEITIELQKLNFSKEGIAARNLLSKWLDASIQVEESTSRLKVIDQRKIQFTGIYQRFAPWGSQLKKIEREIALAENSYLENLHSFNQARLHLQNTLMVTNLKILEEPFFPSKPEKSKKLLLLALAFLCGFIVPLSIIIAIEYLDRTMKNPIESTKRLNLPLSGAFPFIRTDNNWSMGGVKIDYVALRKYSTRIITKNLVFNNLSEDSEKRPKVIGLSSIRGKEGTTFLAKQIVRNLRKYGKVLFVTEDDQQSIMSLDVKHLKMASGDLVAHGKALHELLDFDGSAIMDYDYIVVDLPAFIHDYLPVNLFSFLDHMLIVCKSNRVWTNADQQTWDDINSLLKISPKIVINGVRPDIMEEFIGELPKRRSWLRIKLKDYLRFNFSGSTGITS